MIAREMMRKDVLIIDPDELIVNVMNKLQRKEVGFVYKEGIYYGGITRLHILKKRINFQEMKARTVAIRTPRLDPSEKIEKIAKRMIESDFFYLPVFEEGDLVGEVDYWTVMEFGKEVLRSQVVRNVMTREVITIKGSESIGKAIAMMRKNRISHLPVVDKDGNVLGIITSKDIILKIISPRDRKRYGDWAGEKIIPLETPVREIVEPTLPLVSEESNLVEVVDVMKRNNSTACLIMDGRDLKGIITRKDILEVISQKIIGEDFHVTISSNFPIDKEYIMYYVGKVWKKFSSFLKWGRMFVYIKREGRPPSYRYVVRVKLRSHPGFWVSKAEDYLFDISLRDAFDILEMEILRDKEEFLNRPEVVEL